MMVLGIVLIFLNLLVFIVMFLDKKRAKIQGKERFSEGYLFFMAILFSSIGLYLGMYIFRHKIKKWYFVIGIPLLAMQNLAFIYLLYSQYTRIKPTID